MESTISNRKNLAGRLVQIHHFLHFSRADRNFVFRNFENSDFMIVGHRSSSSICLVWLIFLLILTQNELVLISEKEMCLDVVGVFIMVLHQRTS